MKENQSVQLKESSSIESNESMSSMSPPAFGLQASSLSNSAPGTGQAVQLMVDPAAPIQMADMRTDYPWQGVVDNAGGTLLMLQENVCTENDIQLPQGTRLTVLSRNGDYFKVSANGQEGWVQFEHVDDVVSNHIEENMVGDEMKWDQSGAGGGTDFAAAALDNTVDANGDHNTAMPTGAPGDTVNCWEMILLAAYQVGVLDRDTIHNWYANDNIAAMMPVADGQYTVGDPASATPQRGDFVFMNGLSHVVIAQGDRDAAGNLKVWSFWPPSDFTPAQVQAAIAAGDIDSVKTGRVQDTTIEYLADWMTQLGLNGNPITFGTPAW